MTKSLLIWVGRDKKATPATQMAETYRGRICHFTQLAERILKPQTEKTNDVQRAKQLEENLILKEVTPSDYVILCDERGKGISSPDLAKLLADKELAGTRRIVWIIGGSMGVTANVRKRADFMLSLSKMTLPHALARILLLEQIYRAFCIRNHHPYHHEG